MATKHRREDECLESCRMSDCDVGSERDQPIQGPEWNKGTDGRRLKFKGELEIQRPNTALLYRPTIRQSRKECYWPSTDELAFAERRVRTAAREVERSRLTPQRVFAPDERVQIPNTLSSDAIWAKSICSIIVTTRTGQLGRGTGWFAGPRTIVTAAHNLYFHQHGGWVVSARIIPGRNGTIWPFGSFEVPASELWVVQGWINNADSEADYGAIRVPQEYATRFGAQIGYFGFATRSDSDLSQLQANIAGFPTDVNVPGSLWWDGGEIAVVKPRTLQYTIDTSEGQSGAPVWVKENGKRIVVGIHNYDAGSENQATRITSEVFTVIKGWKQTHS